MIDSVGPSGVAATMGRGNSGPPVETWTAWIAGLAWDAAALPRRQ